jgi:protein-S-isoprenylcysteine O-methyltransferase Ste14
MMSMPLAFSWPQALAFWAVYLWTFHLAELKVSAAPARSAALPAQDTLRNVKRVWVAGLLLAFGACAFAPARLPPTAQQPLFWFGLAAMLCGSALRRHCFRMLGAAFTLDLRAAADQPLIERGAYAWVRHPSYSAGMLMLAGLGLALGSWASLVLLVTMGAVLYQRRIRAEEREMASVLGERWLRYAAGRPRVLPFVC